MRRVEEILADGRDDLVSEIARYLADCRGPSTGCCGAAGATAGSAGGMVDAFLESVDARRVSPMVAWAERVARNRSCEGWQPGEIGAALDLLESLAVARCADQPGSEEAGRKVVSSILEAARKAYGRERADTRL